MDKYDHLVKLVIIGESGVGKSALLGIYCDHVYNDSSISTIGVDFKLKTINLSNEIIKIQIWDTAGQERFRAMTASYYRGANAIILVFDLTNLFSFIKLTQWIKDLKNYLPNNNYSIILIGNKCENKEAYEVSKNDIDLFIKEHHLEYFEVSAKKNINVNEVFNKSITDALKFIENNKTKFVKIKEINKNNKCCD